MLNRKLRKRGTATSATDRDRGSRHITGRHVRMIVVAVVALAAALTGVTITAPRASADFIPCSTQYFGPPGSPYYLGTYSRCVRDEQVLLNDLWYHGGTARGTVNQLLAADGDYGPDTASDVHYYNAATGQPGGDITTPYTWGSLCFDDELYGYTGTYWHDASCNLVV